VDRRALPEPDGGPREEGYVAPRTPVEEVLASIWAQVLGLERVGIHDNFFELGGHSLLAAQVIWRLRDSLQTEIALRSLFDTLTIAGLAAVILSDPNQQEQIERNAQLLLRVAQFSDEEVERFLSQKHALP